MVDTPCFHHFATSPECHVDILSTLYTQNGLIPLFCQCKYLHFTLDTVDLCTDCIFYLNLVCCEPDQNELDCTNL